MQYVLPHQKKSWLDHLTSKNWGKVFLFRGCNLFAPTAYLYFVEHKCHVYWNEVPFFFCIEWLKLMHQLSFFLHNFGSWKGPESKSQQVHIQVNSINVHFFPGQGLTVQHFFVCIPQPRVPIGVTPPEQSVDAFATTCARTSMTAVQTTMTFAPARL